MHLDSSFFSRNSKGRQATSASHHFPKAGIPNYFSVETPKAAKIGETVWRS
jgi:hypothetical protein